MKAGAVTENITQLTRFGAVNAHLVAEDDGYTLVDTMVKGSHGKLLEAAAALDAPIVRLLLTHAHDDHVGSLEALARALPEAAVLASSRDAKLILGSKEPEPGEPKGRLLGSYPPVDVTFQRELADGDRVGSLQVIATPGHSPGHISLLDTRENALLAGDAFSGIGGVATTAGPYWRFPLPGLVTWHRPTALASAAKLADLKPDWLLFGHGKPVKDPGPEMQKAVERSS
ncbi:MAG: MBL fold metallo-hydrolase [Actinomycetota bacterium]|nr:MBL fold metallo-hydrolase [Actinomycetota bacterium]